MVQTAGEDEQEAAAEAAEAFLAEELPEAMFGAPKAGAGMWASCLRIMHPTEGRTLDLVQFEQNEAVFRYMYLHVCNVQQCDLPTLYMYVYMYQSPWGQATTPVYAGGYMFFKQVD